MRQNIKRKARNFPVRSKLKTLMKNAETMIKEGNIEEVKKTLPEVYSIIDMACKKKIIHPNNAARKKSKIARSLNELESKGGAAPAAEKPKKAAKPKKEKVEKKEEKVEKEA